MVVRYGTDNRVYCLIRTPGALQRESLMNYRHATAENLTAALLDARSRTLALVTDLDEQQLRGPKLSTINPLCWEIAHTAYFHELWVLRHLGKQQEILPGSDELFDSISIQHERRWDLPLPDIAGTLRYMDDVLSAELLQLNQIELEDSAKYFYLLALFHEDMHGEALTYTRQILAYPAPGFMQEKAPAGHTGAPANEDIEIAGGRFMLGTERNGEFVFDNEKWAHKVALAPFSIARYAVSNQDYAEFVEAKGYTTEKYWCQEGWCWRCEQGLECPVYWKKDSDHTWYARQFDQWHALALPHPVIHVSWYEARAFCRWANRRLPTEAEWEFAAACNPENQTDDVAHKTVFPWGDDASANCANLDSAGSGTAAVDACSGGDSAPGCRQMLGNVWEWTDSTFLPYPGFSPDWYTEYSRPLFGQTKVLRGGAWTTRGRMIRNTWRNYYGAGRNDVFAGFRTCARS